MDNYELRIQIEEKEGIIKEQAEMIRRAGIIIANLKSDFENTIQQLHELQSSKEQVTQYQSKQDDQQLVDQLYRIEQSYQSELQILKNLCIQQPFKIKSNELPQIPISDICYKQELLKYVDRESKLIEILNNAQQNIQYMIQSYTNNIENANKQLFTQAQQEIDALVATQCEQETMVYNLLQNVSYSLKMTQNLFTECIVLWKQSQNRGTNHNFEMDIVKLQLEQQLEYQQAMTTQIEVLNECMIEINRLKTNNQEQLTTIDTQLKQIHSLQEELKQMQKQVDLQNTIIIQLESQLCEYDRNQQEHNRSLNLLGQTITDIDNLSQRNQTISQQFNQYKDDVNNIMNAIDQWVYMPSNNTTLQILQKYVHFHQFIAKIAKGNQQLNNEQIIIVLNEISVQFLDLSEMFDSGLISRLDQLLKRKESKNLVQMIFRLAKQIKDLILLFAESLYELSMGIRQNRLRQVQIDVLRLINKQVEYIKQLYSI